MAEPTRPPTSPHTPDVARAILGRLVHGWDFDHQDAFFDALTEARRLLGVMPPRRGITHEAPDDEP